VQEWAGCSLQWIAIEVAVFFAYVLTMVLLLCKARVFLSVSIDNAFQFEPKQMLAMATRLIDCVDFDFMLKKRNKARTRRFFVNRVRTFETDGVRLKILLNEEDYDKLYERVFHRQEYMTVDEVASWVQRCIVGDITKEDLDKQRLRELNSLDMMQNFNIIYNNDVLIEM